MRLRVYLLYTCEYTRGVRVHPAHVHTYSNVHMLGVDSGVRVVCIHMERCVGGAHVLAHAQMYVCIHV